MARIFQLALPAAQFESESIWIYYGNEHRESAAGCAYQPNPVQVKKF